MLGIFELVVLAFFCATAWSLFTAGWILTARPPLRHRGWWALLALVLPLVGPLLYLTIGQFSRRRPAAPPNPR